MDKPTRKTTLKDVARMCDVSPMTVSKMLNGKGGVSKETSKRIRQAIRQLNYTPNLVAKSLRVNKTRTFGVVTSDSSDLLFSKMIRGIVDAAAAADYSVIIANTNQSAARESEYIRVLLNKRIDGLLLAAPFQVDAERIREVASFGIPLVLLMRSSALPVDYVTSDNHRGGYEMVAHLVEHGCRDFRFLSLPASHLGGAERVEGGRRALRDAGLPDDAPVHYFTQQFDASQRQMRDMIAGGLGGGTLVCGCDVIAVGVIKAVLEAGLAVPGDFRVTGYDDIEMLDYLNVPLTTVRQPVYTMGQEGVRLLLRRMEEPDMAPVQTRLPCELIVRMST